MRSAARKARFSPGLPLSLVHGTGGSGARDWVWGEGTGRGLCSAHCEDLRWGGVVGECSKLTQDERDRVQTRGDWSREEAAGEGGDSPLLSLATGGRPGWHWRSQERREAAGQGSRPWRRGAGEARGVAAEEGTGRDICGDIREGRGGSPRTVGVRSASRKTVTWRAVGGEGEGTCQVAESRWRRGRCGQWGGRPGQEEGGRTQLEGSGGRAGEGHWPWRPGQEGTRGRR